MFISCDFDYCDYFLVFIFEPFYTCHPSPPVDLLSGLSTVGRVVLVVLIHRPVRFFSVVSSRDVLKTDLLDCDVDSPCASLYPDYASLHSLMAFAPALYLSLCASFCHIFDKARI